MIAGKLAKLRASRSGARAVSQCDGSGRHLVPGPEAGPGEAARPWPHGRKPSNAVHLVASAPLLPDGHSDLARRLHWQLSLWSGRGVRLSSDLSFVAAIAARAVIDADEDDIWACVEALDGVHVVAVGFARCCHCMCPSDHVGKAWVSSIVCLKARQFGSRGVTVHFAAHVGLNLEARLKSGPFAGRFLGAPPLPPCPVPYDPQGGVYTRLPPPRLESVDIVALGGERCDVFLTLVAQRHHAHNGGARREHNSAQQQHGGWPWSGAGRAMVVVHVASGDGELASTRGSAAVLWTSSASAVCRTRAAVQLRLPAALLADPAAHFLFYFVQHDGGGGDGDARDDSRVDIVRAVACLPLYPRPALFLPETVHGLQLRAPAPHDVPPSPYVRYFVPGVQDRVPAAQSTARASAPRVSAPPAYLAQLLETYTPGNVDERVGDGLSFKVHFSAACTRVVQHEALLDFTLGDRAGKELLDAICALSQRRSSKDGSDVDHILSGVSPFHAFCLRTPFMRRVERLWKLCEASMPSQAYLSSFFELFADFAAVLLSDQLCEAKIVRVVCETLWGGGGSTLTETHFRFLQAFCAWLCTFVMTSCTQEAEILRVGVEQCVSVVTILCHAISASTQPRHEGAFVGTNAVKVVLRSLHVLWRVIVPSDRRCRLVLNAVAALFPGGIPVLSVSLDTDICTERDSCSVVALASQMCQSSGELGPSLSCAVFRAWLCAFSVGTVFVESSAGRLRAALFPLVAGFATELLSQESWWSREISYASDPFVELRHALPPLVCELIRSERKCKASVAAGVDIANSVGTSNVDSDTIARLCTAFLTAVTWIARGAKHAENMFRCVPPVVVMLSTDDGVLLKAFRRCEQLEVVGAAWKAIRCCWSAMQQAHARSSPSQAHSFNDVSQFCKDQLSLICVFVAQPATAFVSADAWWTELATTQTALILMETLFDAPNLPISQTLGVLERVFLRLAQIWGHNPRCADGLVDAQAWPIIVQGWCDRLVGFLNGAATKVESGSAVALSCLYALHQLEQAFGKFDDRVDCFIVVRLMSSLMQVAAAASTPTHPESLLNSQCAPELLLSPVREAFASAGLAPMLAALLLCASSRPAGICSDEAVDELSSASEREMAKYALTKGPLPRSTQLSCFLYDVYNNTVAVRRLAVSPSVFDLDSTTTALSSLRTLIRLHDGVDHELCTNLLELLYAVQFELQDSVSMAYVALARAQIMCGPGTASNRRSDAVSKAVTELTAVGAWEAALKIVDDADEACARLHARIWREPRQALAFFAVVFSGPSWNGDAGARWFLYLRRAAGDATELAKSLGDAYPDVPVTHACDGVELDSQTADRIHILPAHAVTPGEGAHFEPSAAGALNVSPVEDASDHHALFFCFASCAGDCEVPGEGANKPSHPSATQLIVLEMDGGPGTGREPERLRWVLPRERPSYVYRMRLDCVDVARIWLRIYTVLLQRPLRSCAMPAGERPAWALSALAFALELALSPLFTRNVGFSAARQTLLSAEEADEGARKARRRLLKQCFLREKRWCERMGMQVPIQPNFEKLARQSDDGRTSNLVKLLHAALQALDNALATYWDTAQQSPRSSEDREKLLQTALWLESLRVADAL